MKYYISFLQIPCFCLLIMTSFAQDTMDDNLLHLNEISHLQVLVEQRPLADWSGVKKAIKIRDFALTFDTTSATINKEYKSNLMISHAKISLIRNDKIVGFTIWRQGSSDPFSVFYGMVQVGDRYEIAFSCTAQRKTGEKIALSKALVYNFPIL